MKRHLCLLIALILSMTCITSLAQTYYTTIELRQPTAVRDQDYIVFYTINEKKSTFVQMQVGNLGSAYAVQRKYQIHEVNGQKILTVFTSDTEMYQYKMVDDTLIGLGSPISGDGILAYAIGTVFKKYTDNSQFE